MTNNTNPRSKEDIVKYRISILKETKLDAEAHTDMIQRIFPEVVKCPA